MTLFVNAQELDTPGDAAARPHGNCYWLLPQRLLAGEHPGAAGEEQLQQRLLDLQAVGVSACIDLTSPSDPVPAYLPPSAAGHAGLKIRHCINDFGVPSIHTMTALVADVQALLNQGRTVYVHCRAGIGRTGLVAACLMVSAGLRADDALALLARKWQVVDKRHAEPSTPETQAQRQFVYTWQTYVEAQRVAEGPAH